MAEYGRPRLIVFGPSHFCERARWGLDHAGISYSEERWVPGPHVVLARRLKLKSAGTPILILSTGEVIQGSDRILDFAGLPRADLDVEMRFENEIGPLVRQFIYSATLGNPASGVREALLDGATGRLAWAGRVMWPVTRRLMLISMQTRPDLLPDLTQKLEAQFGWFAQILEPRGEHLVGDGFGRADLTAASLLAPLAAPPGCPVHSLYARVRLPPEIDARVGQWRRGTVLSWVTRTYAAHRRSRPSNQTGSDG